MVVIDQPHFRLPDPLLPQRLGRHRGRHCQNQHEAKNAKDLFRTGHANPGSSFAEKLRQQLGHCIALDLCQCELENCQVFLHVNL
jgi:hypothetical protein